MTVGHLVEELWQLLGAPSNLDPMFEDSPEVVDVTSPNTQRLIRVLDWAQNQIVSWKDGKFTQRMIIWSGAFHRRYLQLYWYDLICGESSSLGTLTFSEADRLEHVDSDGNPIDFTGMWAVYGDEVQEIVADTGTNLILGNNFSTSPALQGIEIFPASYEVPDNVRIKSIQKVWVQGTGAELEQAPREERFMIVNPDIGAPSQFFVQAKKLFLDKVPKDPDYPNGIYLRIEVEQAPLSLTTMDLDEEPEIPPQFHWGMILWAAGWGHGLMQEETRMAAYRTEFRDFMRETINEADMSQFMSDGYGVRIE